MRTYLHIEEIEQHETIFPGVWHPWDACVFFSGLPKNSFLTMKYFDCNFGSNNINGSFYEIRYMSYIM
jgi:hypothetical protein